VTESALTARTRVERGRLDLPHPRSEKEEDQGEREAD
jgi:hypothetical protein